MPVAAAAAVIGGTSLIGGVMGNRSANKAADKASAATQASDAMAIEEQRRQFDAMQKLLEPYSKAGNQALTGQQNLLGLNGIGAQQSAISGLENSPQMDAYIQQGENSLLQNASATGGLRGGNTQSALAQFRPQLLNQMINQQYANLGGITSLGQNAAAQTGNAGMSSANSIGALMQNTGSAQAANAMARGQNSANLWSGLGGLAGQLGGAYIGSKF